MKPNAICIPVLCMLVLAFAAIAQIKSESDGDTLILLDNQLIAKPKSGSDTTLKEPIAFALSIDYYGSLVRCGEGLGWEQVLADIFACNNSVSPMYCIEPGFVFKHREDLFTFKVGFSEKQYSSDVISGLPEAYRKYQKSQFFDFEYLTVDFAHQFRLLGDFAFEPGTGIQLRFPQQHYNTSIYLGGSFAAVYKGFGIKVSGNMMIFTPSYRNWQDETFALFAGVFYRFQLPGKSSKKKVDRGHHELMPICGS